MEVFKKANELDGNYELAIKQVAEARRNG